MACRKTDEFSMQSRDKNGECEPLIGSTTETKWYTVNKDMLVSKLCYFATGAKSGGQVGFYILFLTSVGLNATQAGILNAIRSLGLFTGNTMWGVLADKNKAHRLVLRLVGVLSILFISLQPVSAYTIDGVAECPSNETSIQDVQQPHASNQLVLAMNVLAFLFEFCNGSLLSFVEAGVVGKIKTSRKVCEYGRQKTFGSFGHGIGVFTSTILLVVLNHKFLACYSVIFLTYVFYNVILFFALQSLYKNVELDAVQTTKKFNKEVFKVLRRVDILIILFSSLVSGVFYALNLSYSMLFMKQLKASNVLIALAQIFASLSAVTAYILSTRIRYALRGTWNSVLFSIAVWLARCILISLAQQAWVILITELLHGLSFSLFTTCIAELFRVRVSAEIYATMFGISNALGMGVGSIVGNSLGGLIYQDYGPRTLYAGMSALAGFWFVVVGCYRLKFLKEDEERVYVKSQQT